MAEIQTSSWVPRWLQLQLRGKIFSFFITSILCTAMVVVYIGWTTMRDQTEARLSKDGALLSKLLADGAGGALRFNKTAELEESIAHLIEDSHGEFTGAVVVGSDGNVLFQIPGTDTVKGRDLARA